MKAVLNIIIVLSVLIFQHASLANTETVENKLTIEQLTPNLYQHTSFNKYKNSIVPSNGLIYIIEKEAVIVDTPWSEAATHKLLSWIEQQGLAVKLSVSTHSHADRTVGIAILNNLNIATYALDKTNQILKDENKATAKHSFAPPMVELVNGSLELHYVGGGHTVDNIVVWLPQEKVLFGGCMIKSLGSKHLGYIGEADLAAWPNSLEQLKQQFSEAQLVIPGHGKLGDMSLVEHSITLLQQHSETH